MYVVLVSDQPITPEDREEGVVGPFDTFDDAVDWASSNPHYITNVVKLTGVEEDV